MSDQNKILREQFDDLFNAWQRVIKDPEVRMSSRPQDYIDNAPYRAIVELGEEVLPFIIEKLEQGVFLLNQAVADVTGVNLDKIIEAEAQFPSEQKKSELIIKWWKSKRRE